MTLCDDVTAARVFHQMLYYSNSRIIWHKMNRAMEYEMFQSRKLIGQHGPEFNGIDWLRIFAPEQLGREEA